MSFETEEKTVADREAYKQVKAKALNLISQATVWHAEYTELRAEVSPDKQAELDAKKASFISALRAALGI